jgi:hypothetical protein
LNTHDGKSPSTPSSSSATDDSSLARGRDEMRELADRTARQMSRAEVVNALIRSASERRDKQLQQQQQQQQQGGHFDGRSGGSGDKDGNNSNHSSTNALIACRQAHVLAGTFGLTDLKAAISEQLRWVKVMGFASKGKWQFAYVFCSIVPPPFLVVSLCPSLSVYYCLPACIL